MLAIVWVLLFDFGFAFVGSALLRLGVVLLGILGCDAALLLNFIVWLCARCVLWILDLFYVELLLVGLVGWGA